MNKNMLLPALAAGLLAISLFFAPAFAGPAFAGPADEALNVPAALSLPDVPALSQSNVPPASLSAATPAAPIAFAGPRAALVAALLTGAGVLAFALRKARLNALLTGRWRPRLVSALNTLPDNVGTTENARRYKATAAVAARYLLGKIGADEDHVAVMAATSDQPIGVMTDEAAAAEDPIDVELLGVSNRTLLMVASEAIDENEPVYGTAAGKVSDKPTAAGTYWKVGTAATPAEADDDPIEVIPCTPEKLTIVAALSSTNGTAAAAIPGALTSTNGTAAAAIPGALTSTDGTAAAASADLAALAAEAEKIGDDTRDIHAAVLLLAAETEKAGDDTRAIHAAFLLLAAEVEKIGDDVRALAAAQAAATHGVALATS